MHIQQLKNKSMSKVISFYDLQKKFSSIFLVRRLQAYQLNPKSHKKPPSIFKQPKRISNDSTQSETPLLSPPPPIEKSFTGKGRFYDLLLAIGIIILLLHIYLCYKLYAFDQKTFSLETITFNQCKQSEFN